VSPALANSNSRPARPETSNNHRQESYEGKQRRGPGHIEPSTHTGVKALTSDSHPEGVAAVDGVLQPAREVWTTDPQAPKEICKQFRATANPKSTIEGSDVLVRRRVAYAKTRGYLLLAVPFE
jgi:hypothetical protein